jgi:hypothetical protein
MSLPERLEVRLLLGGDTAAISQRQKSMQSAHPRNYPVFCSRRVPPAPESRGKLDNLGLKAPTRLLP